MYPVLDLLCFVFEGSQERVTSVCPARIKAVVVQHWCAIVRWSPRVISESWVPKITSDKGVCRGRIVYGFKVYGFSFCSQVVFCVQRSSAKSMSSGGNSQSLSREGFRFKGLWSVPNWYVRPERFLPSVRTIQVGDVE